MNEEIQTAPTTLIAFEVEGEPVPQGSMVAFVIKATGRAAMHPLNNGVYLWRNHVKRTAMQAFGSREPFAGSVRVTLRFWLTRPKSVAIKKRPLPACKPDVDKLTRAVLDALTKVAYADDGQVCDVRAQKRYADVRAPGLSVIVEQIESDAPECLPEALALRRLSAAGQTGPEVPPEAPETK